MFSTKRLNKKALGKWGIGAKAGLSTGVESYQMRSRYNGKEYEFDIFNDRYHSIVPRFDVDTGLENPFELWKVKVYTSTGSIEEVDLKVYFRKTSEKNGVKVSIDVKNPIRNKHKYIDAVKSQLTYFKDVKLKEINCFGGETDHKVQTEILFQNDHFIIPEENYYTVPHLILNNVNYGKIDFGEMEMDEKKGNIGIIGDPSEIDVNQSRESVRYTEKTRNSIAKYLDNSISVADEYMRKEFEELGNDFVSWIGSCRAIRSKTPPSTSVIGRIAGLADLSSLKLAFGDTDIVYTAQNFKTVFEGFVISKIEITKKPNGAISTNTTNVTTWGEFSGNNLMYRDSVLDRIQAIKIGYISEEILPGSGNVLYMATPMDEGSEEYQEYIKDLILNSARGINYSEIDVPDEYIEEKKEAQKEYEAQLEKEEEERNRRILELSLTAEEVRKRDGKFLCHVFRISSHRLYNRRDFVPEDFTITYSDNDISRCKQEVEIDEVSERFNKTNTVYGTQEDIPLLHTFLRFCNSLEIEHKGIYQDKFIVGGSDFEVIAVSKNVAKFINSHATHVKEALQSFDSSGKLIMMDKVVNYNTAKQFAHDICSSRYAFLGLFSDVDYDAYSCKNSLQCFVSDNGFYNLHKPTLPLLDEIDAYLDKVRDFQLYVIENSDDQESIKCKSKELFGTDQVTDSLGLNMEYYAMFKALEDYTESIRPLLLPYKESSSSSMVDVDAIREYLKFKGVKPFKQYRDERFEEFNVPLPQESDTQ